MDRLVVNLDEFAELCSVTSVTMRSYLKAVEGEPDWLIERGSRGRDYQIDAHAAVAWWKKLRDDETSAEAGRAEQFAQLRLELTGGVVESEEALALSGKQRIQEYAAAEAAAKYRKTMGDLLDRSELVDCLSSAVVELRRRLMQVPREFAIREGFDPRSVAPLEEMVGRAIEEFLRTIAKDSNVDELRDAGAAADV